MGNDSNAVYEYDIANKLRKLTNNIDEGSSITFEYSNYDKVGNRKNMLVDGDESKYDYDNLYQLVFADYPAAWGVADVNYYYDDLGSRTSTFNGNTTTYNCNNLNQYTSVGGTGYSYDNSGNLTNDGTYKYYYDCENRLTDVNNQSDNPVASYKYDFSGRRIEKTIYSSPDVTTKYCYDGDQIIAEYDGSGNLQRKFVYGPGIDEPICMIDVTNGDKVYYYHFDGLGSVIALSDSDASIVERYSYDVFGEPNRTSSIGNPYLFTARAYDNETGNYYYRARYYKPSIGRFLQTDPVGYAAGLNLYTYCRNRPILLCDPFGLYDYNSDETRTIFERMKNDLNPFGPAIQPAKGGYDFWVGDSDTYDVPFFGKQLDDLSGSRTANFAAGLKGAYQYGPLETIGTFGGGYVYAMGKFYENHGFGTQSFWGNVGNITIAPGAIVMGFYYEATDGSWKDISLGTLEGYYELGDDWGEISGDIFHLIKSKIKK